MHGANLLGADLHGADLTGCDLREAYLSGANLSGAILTDALLEGAEVDNLDTASRKSLKGAESWNKGRRLRFGSRVVAASVAALLLLGGAVSYSQGLRSMTDVRRFAEEIVASISELGSAGGNAGPRPTATASEPSANGKRI